MNEQFFEKNISISLSKDFSPVRFVHKRTAGEAEKHFLHLNDYIEIYVFVSGDVDYIVEDDYIPLEAGDAVIILPHDLHVPVIKSQSVYERFYMLIPLDAFSFFHFDVLGAYRSIKKNKIYLPPEAKERLLKLLYEVSRLSDEGDTPAVSLQRAGLLLQIQGLLSGFANDKNTFFAPEISSEMPEKLKEILKYISTNAQDICGVKDIAKRFFVSYQYLASLFNRYVGVNVNYYLRMKRIALAKGYLESGRSVAEACYDSGFSDSSHFIKTFREFVGMTPKQYKNLFLKKTV